MMLLMLCKSVFLLIVIVIVCLTCDGVVLNVPSTDYPTLPDAIDVVMSNDIIQLAPGTFNAANCGVVLMVNNVTITGSGIHTTILECNSSSTLPFLINCEGTRLMNFTLTNIGLPDVGVGLIAATTSRFTISNCVLNRGILAHVPSDYSWRTRGGALEIFSSQGTLDVTIEGTIISDNTFTCTSQLCTGGAVAIITNPINDDTEGRFRFVDSVVANNKILGYGVANSLQGAGIFFSNSRTAPLAITLFNSTFSGNTIENFGSPALGTGGGWSFINIDFGKTPVTVYAPNVSISVSQSRIYGNQITSNFCTSLSATAANGGGMGLFGVGDVTIDNTIFERNVLSCVSTNTSEVSGIAEGTSIFLQGLAEGNPLALQPTLYISNTTFRENLASCVGTGCLSLGAGVQVTVAAAVVMQDIIADGNQVICAGLSCSAQGGFAMIQNGPQIAIGAVDVMKLSIVHLNASRNQALAIAAPPGFIAACNVDLGSCNAPTYGGVVATQSLNGVLTTTALNWNLNDNNVSCAYENCIAFGASFGSAARTISGGQNAEVSSSFESGIFQCGDVECSATNCQALETTWSTRYGTTFPEGILEFQGIGCAFIGNVPPSGNGVYVSPDCEVVVGVGVCFGANSQSPTLSPTIAPTQSDNNSKKSVDATTIIVPSVIGGILVSIAVVWGVWKTFFVSVSSQSLLEPALDTSSRL